MESCRNLFQPGKDFCPNLGDDENEILYFLQNLEKIFSQKYFQRKFFFFLEKYIFESCLQILENPKNFMISFSFPLSFNGVVLGENLSRSFFSPLQRFVGKKSFFKFHLPEMKSLHRKLFLPFILKLFPIQSQINHNSINRFH